MINACFVNSRICSYVTKDSESGILTLVSWNKMSI